MSAKTLSKGEDNPGYSKDDYNLSSCHDLADLHGLNTPKSSEETILAGNHDSNNQFLVHNSLHKHSHNNTLSTSSKDQVELIHNLKDPQRILPQSNIKCQGCVVDEMPTKRRSSRGSRRSGNKDDDQGHLLEPGSSREEDDQRHPQAHTNAPATRTESQEKDDATQADGQRSKSAVAPVAFVTIPTAGISGVSCTESGLKISQKKDCESPVNSASLEKAESVPDRTKTSSSSGSLAHSTNIGADKSLLSTTCTTSTPKSAKSKSTTAKSSSSHQHLEKPQSENLTKSSSKHSGADSQVSHQSASGTADGAASTASGVSSASQRQKPPVVGGRGRQGGGGAGPPLQKVVYYQNRFITIPIDPADRRHCAAGVRIGPGAAVPSERDSSGSAGRGSGAGHGGGKHGGRPGGHQVNNPGGATDNPDNMDPNIAAMAGLGPQPGSLQQAQVIQVAPAPPPKKKKRRTPKILKKIALCLQDNRMRTGNDETKKKIQEMNENQDSTNMILKKILNIIFVTTGITLFLSVVIVIIYTSIGSWWILEVPAPAGWHTGNKDNSIDSSKGKPGSNPGDYEVHVQAPTSSKDIKPPSTTPVTEQDHFVNRLRPEDEDHEFNPTEEAPVDPQVLETQEPSYPFFPYLPEDGEFDDFADYDMDYYNVHAPVNPIPLKPQTRKPTPKATTPKPTTTTEVPFFIPNGYDYYNYDYNSDNSFVGSFGGDAYKRNRLSLKQKLKEKHKLYQFHRRRHRHHRHRGSS